MASFHITLPSDSNRELFPDNTAAKYRVQLSRPVTLSSTTPWEVAATKIIVPSQIQSTNMEAWFQIENVKSKLSRKYFVPGLHFYKSSKDFLEIVSKKLDDAVESLKETGFLAVDDEITLSARKNPPHFTIKTNLSQFEDFNGLNSAKFARLIINQELANLFGLPNEFSLQTVNHYHVWRKEIVPWYKHMPNDLWFILHDFRNPDPTTEEKLFLPDIISYPNYKSKKDFFRYFMFWFNSHADAKFGKTRMRVHEDETSWFIQITTKLNDLPGPVINNIKHFDGFTLSPALAYVLGLRSHGYPHEDLPVKLLGQNYYNNYAQDGYSERKYNLKGEIFEEPMVFYYDVLQKGMIRLENRYDALTRNRPEDITDNSIMFTQYIFSERGEDIIDVSNKSFTSYLTTQVLNKDLPVNPFITGRTEFVITDPGNGLKNDKNIAQTEFQLKSRVRVKLGHQQLNLFANNLVDAHCVGNQMKSLLRTVSHNRAREPDTLSTLKEIELSAPYYVPLKPGLRELKNISIQIEDEHNHIMPFAPGKTSLDLHFRPAKRQKISQFTLTVPVNEEVSLQREYSVSNQWSVCLVDLHFPFAWKHVLGNEMKAIANVAGVAREFSVASGEYTVQTFLAVLDNGLKACSDNKVSLKKRRNNKTEYSNPVIINIKSDPYEKSQENSLTLSKDLAQVLGLFESATLIDKWRNGTGNQSLPAWKTINDTDNPDLKVEYARRSDINSPDIPVSVQGSTTVAYRQTKFTFKRAVDLNRGFKLFYVYAPDLINPVHVGHLHVPLLRQFIPQTGNKSIGEFTHHEFENTHYQTVKTGVNNINKVKIIVADELGRPIQFTGNVKPTANLHFKLE